VKAFHETNKTDNFYFTSNNIQGSSRVPRRLGEGYKTTNSTGFVHIVRSKNTYVGEREIKTTKHSPRYRHNIQTHSFTIHATGMVKIPVLAQIEKQKRRIHFQLSRSYILCRLFQRFVTHGGKRWRWHRHGCFLFRHVLQHVPGTPGAEHRP
jgi:hypothetical protein